MADFLTITVDNKCRYASYLPTLITPNFKASGSTEPYTVAADTNSYPIQYDVTVGDGTQYYEIPNWISEYDTDLIGRDDVLLIEFACVGYFGSDSVADTLMDGTSIAWDSSNPL